MARTYRRTRLWRQIEDEYGPHARHWGQNPPYVWVRDKDAPGHHSPGMRRRKRNNLRAWRHAQRINVSKGREVEAYTREWLD